MDSIANCPLPFLDKRDIDMGRAPLASEAMPPSKSSCLEASAAYIFDTFVSDNSVLRSTYRCCRYVSTPGLTRCNCQAQLEH